MITSKLARRIRGMIGNALVWGAGFFTLATLVTAVLTIAGVLPELSLPDSLMVGARFGVVGAIAGTAFFGYMRLLYHGRSIARIDVRRFSLLGAAVGGLYIPVFITAARLLSGDPFLPLAELASIGLVSGVFGGAAAGGSIKLAQRADALASGGEPERIGRMLLPFR